MRRPRKARTYAAKFRAKRVRVTIPGNDPPEEALRDALKDNLSPEAVAALLAGVQLIIGKAKGPDAKRVNRELAWFESDLVVLLGGDKAVNRLSDALGF